MNQTTVICTEAPDERQLSDMEELAALCRRRDRIGISCPVEEDEGTWHFLMYGENADLTSGDASAVLLGVCSMVPCEEMAAECIAFTRPDARRQGVFSELLERALEQFGDWDIRFPVSNHCPDACAVMDAIGAELDSEELAMELELEQWTPTETRTPSAASAQPDSMHAKSARVNSAQVNSAQADSMPNVRLVQAPDWEGGFTQWQLYQTPTAGMAASAPDALRTPASCVSAPEGILLASCRTSALEGGSVCLHHVEVPNKLRRKGRGTLLLTLLFGSLQQNGVKRILLHVSGDNPAALALYRKQGFRITETLSFYLY